MLNSFFLLYLELATDNKIKNVAALPKNSPKINTTKYMHIPHLLQPPDKIIFARGCILNYVTDLLHLLILFIGLILNQVRKIILLKTFLNMHMLSHMFKF